MRRPLAILLPWALAAAAGIRAEPDRPVVLSPVQETRKGQHDRDVFLATHPQSADGLLAVRVDEVGRKIARISDRPGVLYRFMVLQGDELQAYSFTGGTICVTEAVARLDEDLLAFALGHELAHVALRHRVASYRLWVRSGADAEPAPEQLEEMLQEFDQDQEMEADRYGALYAVRAGYRFGSSVAMLKLFRDRPADGAHPPSEERIASLEQFEGEIRRTLQAFHQGTDALPAGHFDDAIDRLRSYVRQFPHSAAGRVNLGMAYLGRVRSAAPLEVVTVLPSVPEPDIVILRGVYDRVDLEQARLQFERALEVAPTEVHALTGIGLTLARLGDLDAARDRLDEALRVTPRRPEVLLCRGNVEYLAGEFETAATHYLAALDVQRDWPPARRNLAMAYERSGRLDAAIESWESLAAEPGLAAEAARRLAHLRRKAG